MSRPPINIAIDGYSSTGKSTLARDLAARLGYRYIDTGAMYRAVTLYALRKGLIAENGIVNKALGDHLAEEVHLEFRYNPERQASDIYLNGENVEGQIRKMEIARYVSEVAAVSAVRRFLVRSQKLMADDKEVVMDGRDIGTVVLPDAELKIFVTAGQAIRVQRRFDELVNRGEKITRREVQANLEQRDLIDTTRDDSPLKMADDARMLDNSELTPSEQLALVEQWVQEVTASTA